MIKCSISKYALLALIIIGCSSSPRYTKGTVSKSTKIKKKVKSSSSSSKSNNVKHRKVMTGISSFYAEDFHGKLPANGEVYDMYGVTAAHKKLPLNTVAKITNTDNGKSLILRITDRGPFVKGRILDCSYGAAKNLGFFAQGPTKVRIELIEVGDNKYMKHKSGS